MIGMSFAAISSDEREAECGCLVPSTHSSVYCANMTADRMRQTMAYVTSRHKRSSCRHGTWAMAWVIGRLM
jgi:hypothetical protein